MNISQLLYVKLVLIKESGYWGLKRWGGLSVMSGWFENWIIVLQFKSQRWKTICLMKLANSLWFCSIAMHRRPIRPL